jgi:hypothetical protein
MNRATLIKAVQTRMSDVMPGSQIEVASNPFVDALLNDSVENFYMMLPTNVLPHFDFKAYETRLVPSDENIIYRIKLPELFIRLIEFRCTSWRRSVSSALPEGSPQHHAQFGKFTFGGNTRPCVTLVSDPQLSRSIEYYFYDSTAPDVSIITASCAVKSDAEDIPANLLDSFAWYVASTAFTAMQEFDASKACMEKVTEFIALHK